MLPVSAHPPHLAGRPSLTAQGERSCSQRWRPQRGGQHVARGGTLIAALALAACVGELDDPEAVRSSRVILDPLPRAANEPPEDDEAANPGPVEPNPQKPANDTPTTEPASPATEPEPNAEDPLINADAGPPEQPAPEEDPEALLMAECGDVPRDIFGNENKCGTALCHGSPSKPISGDLGVVSDLGDSTSNIYERLVDVELTSGPCSGHKLIDPQNADESLLISKLASPPACGNVMPFPLPGFQITAEERDCIVRWTRLQIDRHGP